jgi:hypothetical protein
MILSSWRSGWRRVLAAPAIAAGVLAMTLLLALPLTLVMRDAIASHLGSSLAAARAADGVNWDWWQQFSSQTTGVGTSLTPSVIGFAATIDSVSRVLDGPSEIIPIALAIAAYLVGWAFISAGIIDRYARQRPTRAHGFFGAAGGYAFRFMRLGVCIGIVYWWLFAYVHPWVFIRLFGNLTRDLNVERTAFLWRLSLYAIFGAVLMVVNVLADYAKIRIVVEDRRSALGGMAAAWRFIRRHPGDVSLLYLFNSVTFLVVVAAWAIVAPGAGGAGLGMWVAFLATQCYVVLRLLFKLQFIASQTALFQAHLAHAKYTAEPVPMWPESAAAEAIGPRNIPEASR